MSDHIWHFPKGQHSNDMDSRQAAGPLVGHGYLLIAQINK